MLFLSTIVLPFLKTWWKVLVPVLLVLLLMGYITALKVQINHYKGQVAELRLHNEKVKQAQKNLEDLAVYQTEKYSKSLELKDKEIRKKDKDIQRRIANDKETRRIKLSANTISLFNAPKRDSPTASPTVESDAGKASSTTTPARTGEAGRDDSNRDTLNALLAVVATNDANHIACIQQVQEWQNFWKDFEASVKVVSNAQPR